MWIFLINSSRRRRCYISFETSLTVYHSTLSSLPEDVNLEGEITYVLVRGRCATSRTVPGSIPGRVTWDIFCGSFRQNHVPWGRLSLWKWVPGISPGVKTAGAYGWRSTNLVVPNVKKIRGLNLLGTPWAKSACCGMTFTLPKSKQVSMFYWYQRVHWRLATDLPGFEVSSLIYFDEFFFMRFWWGMFSSWQSLPT